MRNIKKMDASSTPHPARSGNSAEQGITSLHISMPLSVGAREVMAEDVLSREFDLNNPALAAYLSRLAFRSSLSPNEFSAIDPFNPGNSVTNFFRLLEIRRELAARQPEGFFSFHLQFGEYVLGTCAITDIESQRHAHMNNAGILLLNPDLGQRLIEHEYECAARGSEEELNVEPGVLAVVSMRPSEILAATVRIRSVFLGFAA